MDWNFKAKNWLLNGAATGMALIMMGSSIAHAQEAPDAQPAAEEVEEDDDSRLGTVKVTGIRASLANSVGLKKSSDLIVEAISAEDIGKLPDVSIAESLARLPGLAIQRIDGRGQQLSIRGLGPDFNSAVLNGREQVTTGDNRGVEFDQFPSELLSAVVVYKTPDASLIGQGLMGTVDLRTIRPLDQSERIIQFGARYEWNEVGALNGGTEDTGYRANFTYVDQFANDTIGVAIGIATNSTPTQANIYNSWGFPTTGAGEFIIGGAKPYAKSNDLDRTGVIGTFQFEPSATFSSTVDLFYSDFDETQVLRGVELPLFWSSAQLEPGYTVVDGLVTEGTFSNVRGVIRNDVTKREATLFSVGWNMEWQVSDDWTLGADLSTSQIERTDVVLETYSGLGYQGNGPNEMINFRLTGDNYFTFTPSVPYDQNVVLTSPQGWGTDAAAGRPFGQTGYLNMPTIEDDLYALRLTAKRELDLGPIADVEFGVNLTSREKTKVADEFFLAVPNGQMTAPIPDQFIVGTTNFDFLNLGGIVSYDPLAMLDAGSIFALSPNVDDDVVTKSWQVEEDVITLYAKFGIESQIGSIPVSGNFGVQVVQTDQSSTGGTLDENNEAAGFIILTEGDEYTEVLPSLSLNFELPWDQVIRVGAARTLARARMDDLRVSRTVGRNAQNIALANPTPNATYWSASGGNPQLKPYLANGIDVAYEKYFGVGGYVGVAAFYKELDNWVVGGNQPYDFSEFTFLLSAQELAQLGSTQGFLYVPVNLEGGYIQGVEVSGNLPFDVLAPVLEGFGATFSASFTESEIEPYPDQPGVSIAIPGLSETVANGTFYYDRYGFSARISARYRDEFLGEVPGFGFSRAARTVEAETIVDAQIGFDFGQSDIDGDRLDGLSILAQAYNITDEPFVTNFGGNDRQVQDYQIYGTTYLVGFSYKFQ